jgi:hypothetical protein
VRLARHAHAARSAIVLIAIALVLPARGLTFSAGLGVKLYFDSWFAIRIDIRDQVLEQELLGESAIVNNLTATLGMSVFLPFTP